MKPVCLVVPIYSAETCVYDLPLFQFSSSHCPPQIVRRNASLYAAESEPSGDQPAVSAAAAAAAGTFTRNVDDEFPSLESDRQRLKALLDELQIVGARVMRRECSPDTRLADLLELCGL
jgi:hypothetical protein